MSKYWKILLGTIVIIALLGLWLAKIKENNILDKEEEEITSPGANKLHLTGREDDEEIMMKIVSAADGDEHLDKVLELLPEIDFDKLEDMHGEGSVSQLLEWLAQQSIGREEDIVVLIDMLDDFYRYEYLQFAQTLTNSYRENKISFLKALGQFPNKVDLLAYAFHDIGVFDELGESLSKDLEIIVNSDELTEQERELGVKLLNLYSECGT